MFRYLLVIIVLEAIITVNSQQNVKEQLAERPCSSNPCKNGAKCVEQVKENLSGYSCVCLDQWFGLNCDQNRMSRSMGMGQQGPQGPMKQGGPSSDKNPVPGDPNNRNKKDWDGSYSGYWTGTNNFGSGSWGGNSANYVGWNFNSINPGYPNGQNYDVYNTNGYNQYPNSVNWWNNNNNNNNNYNNWNNNNNPIYQNNPHFNGYNNQNQNPYGNPYNYNNNGQIGCASSPCLNNGRCLVVSGLYNYRCQCDTFWEGPRCEYRNTGAIIGLILGITLPVVFLSVIAIGLFLFYRNKRLASGK